MLYKITKTNSHRIFEICGIRLKFKRKKKQRKNLSDMLLIDIKQCLFFLKKFNKNYNKINTLILGSSHARQSIVEESQILNVGLGSQDLYYSWQLYVKYNMFLPKLKNVVVFYSIFSPGNDIQRSPLYERSAVYKILLDIPYKNTILAFEQKLNILEENIITDYLPEAFKNPLSLDVNYTGVNTQKNCLTEQQIDNFIESWLKLNKAETKQNHFLQYILNAAQNNSQNVLIVLSPYRNDVRAKLPNSHDLYSDLLILTSRYNNIEILNAYEDEEFVPDDFLDSDHLNYQGACKLTAKIREKLSL